MKYFLISLLILLSDFLYSQVNNCAPPTSQADLDINNVRTTILNGGDMWWDLNLNPKYEVPKGSGKHSIFSGAIWIGGLDAGNQLKLAAQTYRQSGTDFWAGPVNITTGNTIASACAAYDRHWKLTRQEVLDFYNTGIPTQTILDYPGNGIPFYNHTQFLAPFYDTNADGVYDPTIGDYPLFDFGGSNCKDVLLGDQNIWWVFNDVGNIHGGSDGVPIDLKVHAQAYAYSSFDEAINNSTFYQYKIINRSSSTLDSCYFGLFTDFDLGNWQDDYLGCDVGLNLGYGYNGDANDDGPSGYGFNPPAVGSMILEGPIGYNGNVLGMTYFMEDRWDQFNPNPDANDRYLQMQGRWNDGTPLTFGGSGYGGTIPTTYLFPDSSNPANPVLWTEGTAGMLPGDRRFVQSSGTFQMQPGQVHVINTSVVWARADSGGPIASLHKLKTAASTVQNYFDNCFFAVGITETGILNGIKLFPNPSLTGNLKIVNIPAESEISVYNLEGKEFLKGEKVENSFEWKCDAGKGIYFIRIKNKSAEKVFKWINL